MLVATLHNVEHLIVWGRYPLRIHTLNRKAPRLLALRGASGPAATSTLAAAHGVFCLCARWSTMSTLPPAVSPGRVRSTERDRGVIPALGSMRCVVKVTDTR